MRFLFGILTLALFSGSVFANITTDQEYLLNRSGSVASKVQLGTLVNRTHNLLVAKYSYAVQGGTTANDISLLTNLGDPKSYAVLPANAVIKNVWVNVISAPTSGGSATIALKAVNAADLLAATAISSLGTGVVKQGKPFNSTTTTWIKTSAAQTIKATVATATLTAGKFNVFIEYVLSD